MSQLRRPHFLRWTILLGLVISLLASSWVVVHGVLARPVMVTNVMQDPVITALPIDTLLSGQWLLQQINYSLERTQQVPGIANRLDQPLPPTQLQALDAATGNTVLLQWSVPAGQSFAGVAIERDLTDTFQNSLVVTAEALPAGSMVDTTVENDLTYFYRLRSYHPGDDPIKNNQPVYSAWSDVVSVMPTDQTPPAAPLLVTVTSATTPPAGLLISWQPSPSVDTTGYRLYQSITAGELGANVLEVTADYTSARDSHVKPGVTYYYTVTALDAAGNESSTTLATSSSAGHSAPFVTSTSHDN